MLNTIQGKLGIRLDKHLLRSSVYKKKDFWNGFRLHKWYACQKLKIYVEVQTFFL